MREWCQQFFLSEPSFRSACCGQRHCPTEHVCWLCRVLALGIYWYLLKNVISVCVIYLSRCYFSLQPNVRAGCIKRQDPATSFRVIGEWHRAWTLSPLKTHCSGLAVVVLDCWSENHGIESRPWHFDGGERLDARVLIFRRTLKNPRWLKFSKPGVPHNHIMVLGRKSIFMIPPVCHKKPLWQRLRYHSCAFFLLSFVFLNTLELGLLGEDLHVRPIAQYAHLI